MDYFNNDSQFDKGEPLKPEKWESSEGHTVKYIPNTIPHTPHFYTLTDSNTNQYLSNLAISHSGEVMGLETHPEFRRQGLASELWHAAQQFSQATPGVPAPQHSGLRTKAGEQWAKKVGGDVPARNGSLLSPREMNNMIDFKKTDENPWMRLP